MCVQRGRGAPGPPVGHCDTTTARFLRPSLPPRQAPTPVASPPTATTATVAAELAARAGAPPALDALTVLRRPTYTSSYLESVAPTAKPAVTLRDRAARATIRTVRTLFDAATGYKRDAPMSEAGWLRRTIFLETVAGVPGMVAGALRHLRSLRLITYDKGWINTLLQEAENERMHLLCFMGECGRVCVCVCVCVCVFGSTAARGGRATAFPPTALLLVTLTHTQPLSHALPHT